MGRSLRLNWTGKWAARLGVQIVLSTLLIGAAFADGGITLSVKDVPLRDVVVMLTQQSKTNIVLSDDPKLEKRVWASLTNVSLEAALDDIVKGAGVNYRKTDEGTYIIGGAASEVPLVTPETLTPLPADPIYHEAPAAPRAQSRTMTIDLRHSDPRTLLEQLNGMPDRGFVETYLSHAVKSAEKKRLRNAPRTTFVNSGPVVPTLDPSMMMPSANRFSGADGAAQFPGGFGGGGATGYGGGLGGGYGGGIRPGGIAGGTAGVGVPGVGGIGTSGTLGGTSTSMLWPDGIENIQPFSPTNSLIVKGTEDGIAELKTIIHMLDVPPKQVSIKAEFVEVSTVDVKRFGIDWSLDRLNQSFSTAFGPAGNVVAAFSVGNLTAVMAAELTQSVGRVVNAPIISTINNMEASIQITRSIPYFVTTTTIDNGTVVTNSSPEFIDIDSFLSVTPRINGDGTITMYLSPQVSDTGNIVTGPDGQVIPEARDQSLTTVRRVGNGETIVLGGFIRKNETMSYSKIPILADLPIIGQLFKTSNRNSDDRELLIFITATIIPDTMTGLVAGTGASGTGTVTP